MQKKFITNLAFLISINLLIKPFWILGIDRVVQNTVGSTNYGWYYALFSFSLLFNILLDLGITNFNSQNISKHKQLVHKHLSGIIVLRLLLCFVYFILSLISAYVIRYTQEQVIMLLLLMFNQVMLSFILYLRSNISGLHFFRTDSVISVTDRLLMILICGALLIFYKSDFKIEWFVYAQTAGYAITVLITLLVLNNKVTIQKLYWNPTFFLLILKKSLPFAILILLMTFYTTIDKVMIERLLPINGSEQVGIYAQAYRLLDSANMIAFLFAGLLLPMFSHLIKKKQSVEALTKLSYSLISVPAVIIVVGIIFNAENLMGLMYKNHVHESAQVLGVIISCFVAISSVYIFGTLLTANGNLKQLNIMAGCGMLINILLNLYMIPRYEAMGAAITSAVTQFSMAIGQIMLSHKMFNFKIDKKLMLLFLVFVLIVVGLNFISVQFLQNWFLAFCLTGVAGLMAAFGLRLINIPSIFTILKQDENY